jgi:hypothetical protein
MSAAEPATHEVAKRKASAGEDSPKSMKASVRELTCFQQELWEAVEPVRPPGVFGDPGS